MADITGTLGNDTLTGTAGDDRINSLLGNDVVNGRGGSDTLVVDYLSAPFDPYAGASVINLPSVIRSSGGTFSGDIKTHSGTVKFADIEHLEVKLNAWYNTFRIDGSALAHGATIHLDGGDRDDTLVADLSALAGISLHVGTSGTTASFGTIESFEIFELNLTEGDDNVTTVAGDGPIFGKNDKLYGNGGDDVLTSGSGDDVLDGGTGPDRMTGGPGNDSYFVDSADDIVVEEADQGSDRITSTMSYVLPDHFENLILAGEAVDGTGNGADNSLSGNEKANRLDGRAGMDFMGGGAGSDTYIVDNSSDEVLEQSEEGTDSVHSSVSFALAANVENLTLTGSLAIDALGNGLANVITGNSAANRLEAGDDNDRLDGGAGVDEMIGGGGSDSYVVDDPDDLVVELDSGGTDIVESSVTFLLADHIENLTLTGTAAIDGTGNGLGNVLVGNSAANRLEAGDGHDRLDGRAGGDEMSGGLGNDTYVVDNVNDAVTELAAAGTDTIRSSIDHVLGANFERLALTGGARQGTGNELANTLIGNNLANRLDGGIGPDRMEGGSGDDTYLVDDSVDLVIELSGKGTDTVWSTASFTLGDHVENLTLSGSAKAVGTGNELDNVLIGSDANNALIGGLGADTMTGGKGSDTYVVDNYGDRVIETAAGGNDTIYSSVSYTLPTQVERLFLTGTKTLEGRGNAASNTIVGTSNGNVLKGNDGNDTMNGGGGHDRLYGGYGNDILTGGDGNDGFYFDTRLASSNVDSLTDFLPAKDTIYLSAKIFRGIAGGTLPASAFHQGSAAADAADRIVYEAASGRIFYDADGTGAAAQILFATVTPGTALTSADFVI